MKATSVSLTFRCTRAPFFAVLFHRLAEAGFGPAMYGYFANGRIEGWFEATALEPPQMGEVRAEQLKACPAAITVQPCAAGACGLRDPDCVRVGAYAYLDD